ncbi:MAG: hypothetical protein R3Y44_00360 [Rikenellaceae bacterium]
MKIEDIRRQIEELSILVAAWSEDSKPSLIEQDILLSKLADLYQGVKFSSVEVTEAEVEVEVEVEVEAEAEAVAPISESEPVAHLADDSIFAIDIDGVSLVEPEEISDIQVEEEMEQESPLSEPKPELESEPEPEPQVEPEIITEPEPKIDPEPETESESESEPDPEPEPQKCENTLFDLDVVPKQSRRRRSVLMSLYSDDVPPAVTPQSTPKTPAEEHAAEPEQVVTEPIVTGSIDRPVQTISDTFSSNVETVADRLAIATPRVIYEDRMVYHSFDEIGINERYLLARDLFGDDPHLCHEVLTTLNAFDNYDDAMIYIAENFNWNGESEGAKLLLSVLEYKFNIS